MAKIISVANQKGGCTKTSSAMNIGAALANKGNKVLIIDLDPQANLSSYFGFDENGDKDERKEPIVNFDELFESDLYGIVSSDNFSIKSFEEKNAKRKSEIESMIKESSEKREFTLPNPAKHNKNVFAYLRKRV